MGGIVAHQGRCSGNDNKGMKGSTVSMEESRACLDRFTSLISQLMCCWWRDRILEAITSDRNTLVLFTEYLWLIGGDSALSLCDANIFVNKSSLREELLKFNSTSFRNFKLKKFTLNALPDFFNSDIYRKGCLNEVEEILLYMGDRLKISSATLPELFPSDGPTKQFADVNVADAVLSLTISQINNSCPILVQVISNEKYQDTDYPLIENILVNPLDTDEIEQCNTSAVCQAIQYCDKQKICTLLSNHDWIATLMVTTEIMPISLTISSATTENLQFPLLYANKHFETVSGVSRRYSISRPGTFLQTQSTLRIPNQVVKISTLMTAISKMQTFVTTMTCCNRDGHLFQNVIGVKSVFNQLNQDHYVISIQMEVTEQRTQQHTVKMVRALIESLPEYGLHY
mmetsp:Transcript_29829/g.30262  ORF Transcript_29829/g.30262 Transcript_29829/m.30262 type:complete len:400 (-) Transcript_29829:425-1624(-)|eukprot:CAMPEP_0182436360 /NCGR_PEP_ID=MMETSP1167-20130531/81114_1 /TAXON_ID=2988 /ORGANISM="Mallomonas Sp, Strain CCMP3275" /LENGTH=399 /DNA_ID=CAMNT_0024628459 /DNA_START=150 /DNA_END=1349 /DNA_ORIENTATION=-